LVGTRGYELPTNLQKFMQKDLTEVKIYQKVFFWGGGLLFFWNTLYAVFLRQRQRSRL